MTKNAEGWRIEPLLEGAQVGDNVGQVGVGELVKPGHDAYTLADHINYGGISSEFRGEIRCVESRSEGGAFAALAVAGRTIGAVDCLSMRGVHRLGLRWNGGSWSRRQSGCR